MQKAELYKKIHNAISEIDNTDQTLPLLEKVAKHYCNMYDLCEGYKHALTQTLEDQENNHDDESAEDLQEVYNLLTN